MNFSCVYLILIIIVSLLVIYCATTILYYTTNGTTSDTLASVHFTFFSYVHFRYSYRIYVNSFSIFEVNLFM